MEKHNIRLTSSEVANLWANYMGDSMYVYLRVYLFSESYR